MIYSELYLQKKEIKMPFFIFLVIIILTGIFIWRFFSNTPISSRASKKLLARVEIANLSQNQASIYWQTSEKEVGWIIFGQSEKKIDQIFFDERDTKEKRNSYLNHLVILRNLKPGQQYYFKIISNNQLIDNNGQPYTFQTVNDQYLSSNLKPAYGRVLGVDNQLINQGVVLLNLKNAYPLATLIKTTGEWMIPLNNVVDKATNKLRIIESKEKVEIEIFDENKRKSNIEAIIQNIMPVPQIIVIGNDYHFLSNEQILGVEDKTSKDNSISIIYPKEKAVIPNSRPLIKGTALPLKEVFLIIKGNIDYSFRVTTDKTGFWKINLSQNFPPGNYIIQLETKDENERDVKLMRRFTISKSGETVLGEATPEATLTPSMISITPTTIPTTVTPTIKPAGRNPIPLLVTATSFIVFGFIFLLVF